MEEPTLETLGFSPQTIARAMAFARDRWPSLHRVNLVTSRHPWCEVDLGDGEVHFFDPDTLEVLCPRTPTHGACHALARTFPVLSVSSD